MKYGISVRFNGEFIYAEVNDYLGAWEIYRAFVKTYPSDALVDIISLTTGEIFQSSFEED